MEDNLSELMNKLGYEFKNISLLEIALSHRSCGKENNERLEFLGDSILNFIVGNELYNRFPKAREGQLSRLRANLVRGDTLAEMAKEFELSDYIRLGLGETKSGGAHRVSILADAVEAIIGAIFADGGIDACYEKVAKWYQERINELSLDETYKDPKSLLQEFLQAKQLPLPEYRLASVSGKEHEQMFLVECRVTTLDKPARGEGHNRRRAEQLAAKNALKELEK